ncbi:MAG: trigger factor [Rhodanobacteraceae bacterium]
MQVELENLGKLERKLTVKIPADRLDQQFSDRVSRMGREVRLKGFRPGRVPRGVIEKRYGDQIRNEVLSDLIGDSFREAVEQEKLSPVAAPAINTSGKPEEGEIAYTATFEVMPELPEVDVTGFTVEKPVAEVADSDVDEMIETLRNQRRTYETVERKAAAEDMVLFEFEASTSDGRFPEQGRERAGTLLGSNQFNADVEAALEGLKAGDTFELETTFAEPFKFEELAGKLSKVSGKVLRVQEPHLPELDTAFFKAFGIEDGDETSFRDEVRANLDRELRAAMGGRLKGAVAKALAAEYAELELPRVMVVSEARALAGLDQQATMTEEQFRQIEPAARERVIAGLLFNKIARDNEIRVDDQRVGKALAAIASTYEEPEQVVEVYQNNHELMASLRNRVLEEQVAEWVAEKGKCVDKSMSFNELLKPPTQG